MPQERLHHADRSHNLRRSHRPFEIAAGVLSRLCGASLYVINDAALAYMKSATCLGSSSASSSSIRAHFSSPEDWERHLQALGLSG